MSYYTFKRLATLLHPGIVLASGKKEEGLRNHLHNGPILPEVRLACALRWFAGGSIYDIMTTFGISHTDALESCWYVVDAVNAHPSLKIVYPDDHKEQHCSIAHSFSQVSAANFGCCAGAIDGILIWIHKPSLKDCIEAGCDAGKFFLWAKAQIWSQLSSRQLVMLALRIRIECTFGIWTHRWAILRSAIPMRVSLKKTVALVCALAKLHNFCINADDGDVPTSTAHDEWKNEKTGAVPLVPTPNSESSRDVAPQQLLDGGITLIILAKTVATTGSDNMTM